MAKSFGEIWAKLDNKVKPYKAKVPIEIGKAAQKFFVSSFSKQGFTDQSLEKWKPRMYDKKKKDIFRAILVKSGDLRRAVASSLVSANWDVIRFEVSSPYAQYHNEGFKGTVKSHERSRSMKVNVRGSYSGLSSKGKIKRGGASTLRLKGNAHEVRSHDRNLPQRQFIGNSITLNKIILEILNKRLAHLFTK